MTELVIFFSTFALVFALGFQSQNVNNGHYWAAFFTSLAIGVSNLVLFKTVPQADFLQICSYLAGGPFGIVASMWAHRRWMKKKPHNQPSLSKYLLEPGRDMTVAEHELLIKSLNDLARATDSKSAKAICPKHERGGGPCYCPRP